MHVGITKMKEQPKPSHLLKSTGTVSVRRKAVPLAKILLSGEISAEVAKALNMNVHTATKDRMLNRAIPHYSMKGVGV